MNRRVFCPYIVAVVAAVGLIALSTTTYAQQEEQDVVSDSTQIDSVVVGIDSLWSEWSNVVVNMDSSSKEVLCALSQEASEGVMGYRVGIFFDNSNLARSKAQAAVKLCDSLYGDVVTTLSYANPYFKVSAGYCTTLEEALVLLNRLQKSFPSAFLTSEQIMPSHLVAIRDRELAWADTVLIRQEMKSIDQEVLGGI